MLRALLDPVRPREQALYDGSVAKEIVVGPGDCLSSIAHAHGFAPDTLWHLDENQHLRETRPNMFQLVLGDRVHVPDLRPREETCAVDQRHRFRRRGVPERLRIRLWDDHEQPRAGQLYTVEIDGRVEEGVTDEQGRLEHWMSPATKRVVLTFEHDEGTEVHVLELGQQEPRECPPQALERLRELGHLPPGPADPPPTQLHAGLREFQRQRGLWESGDLDRATLWELFRS
jgi:hypothetical protein